MAQGDLPAATAVRAPREGAAALSRASQLSPDQHHRGLDPSPRLMCPLQRCPVSQCSLLLVGRAPALPGRYQGMLEQCSSGEQQPFSPVCKAVPEHVIVHVRSLGCVDVAGGLRQKIKLFLGWGRAGRLEAGWSLLQVGAAATLVLVELRLSSNVL